MWTIAYRGRYGTTTLQCEADADALRFFRSDCEKGRPGRYTLRSSQNAVLATGDVKGDEMAITWHRDRIMCALGTAAAADEVDKAATYLAEVDPQ